MMLPELAASTAGPKDLFIVLSESLQGGWNDEEASSLIQGLADWTKSGRSLDPFSIARWIHAHPSAPQSVLDCLAVDPPSGISILQLLSRAGSQKLVFLANWELAQREVVLKTFIGVDSADKLITRELQPHPLNMAHPNIIETHYFQNKSGERFLVERKLPSVLTDSWDAKGIHEASNLLRDIASALSFLEDRQLVHGDVKPDNIGLEEGRYLLLDFGICRSAEAFSDDVPATGSLRTRAPELLANSAGHSSKSDVWGLGATVFNSLMGRFPLFKNGETPPRVSHPAERSSFEEVLRHRSTKEWSAHVDLGSVPEPIRDLLSKMLDPSPMTRISAGQVVKQAETDLAPFLRQHEGHSVFSPMDELQQLVAFWPTAIARSMMPESQRQDLEERLKTLENHKGLTSSQAQDIKRLREELRNG